MKPSDRSQGCHGQARRSIKHGASATSAPRWNHPPRRLLVRATRLGPLPDGRGSVKVALLLMILAALPIAAQDVSHEELRATQRVVRTLAGQIKPFLVRINTVGGSQPRAFINENTDDADPKRKQERPRNQFRDDPGSRFVIADGATTGIVFSVDGYIITSSFNFVREPLLISVTLPDGRRMVADLIARDQVRKLALLKVDAVGLSVPQWATESQVRVGAWAVAMGLGFGGDDPAVTVGIISGKNRMMGNAIQTDAKLNPANYGGPLCDLQGRIIGLCTPMAQRPGELAGVELYDSGVGFVLPKWRVDEIVAKLMTGESVYRGWLGFAVDSRGQESQEGPKGVTIGRIADPSPMATAGVQPGDRIVKAQGRDIHQFGNLIQAIYMIPAGDPVTLTIAREDDEFDITIKLARNTNLGPLPEPPPE